VPSRASDSLGTRVIVQRTFGDKIDVLQDPLVHVLDPVFSCKRLCVGKKLRVFYEKEAILCDVHFHATRGQLIGLDRQ